MRSILALERTRRAFLCQEGQCHMHLALLGFCTSLASVAQTGDKLAGLEDSLNLPFTKCPRQFFLPVHNHSGTMSGNPNSHISQHVDLLEIQSPPCCPVSGEAGGWGGKSSSLSLQINDSRDHVISSKVYPCGVELTVLGSDHFSSWHLEVGSRKGK